MPAYRDDVMAQGMRNATTVHVGLSYLSCKQPNVHRSNIPMRTIPVAGRTCGHRPEASRDHDANTSGKFLIIAFIAWVVSSVSNPWRRE
ncbi:hypothetical protein PG988_013913 [Apiospora saccharicola]